jgi:hypothetical protein
MAMTSRSSGGTVRVTIGAAGELRESFVPQIQEPVDLADLVLQLGEHTIPAAVTDADGAPAAAYLSLQWRPADGQAAGSLQSASLSLHTQGGTDVPLGPFPPGVLEGVVCFGDDLQLPVATAVPATGVLHLLRPATVTMQVRVIQNGKPVSHARAWASTWVGNGPAPESIEDFARHVANAHALSGDDGVATVSVVAGEVLLSVARVPGGQPVRQRLRVSPGAALSVDVVLP